MMHDDDNNNLLDENDKAIAEALAAASASFREGLHAEMKARQKVDLDALLQNPHWKDATPYNRKVCEDIFNYGYLMAYRNLVKCISERATLKLKPAPKEN